MRARPGGAAAVGLAVLVLAVWLGVLGAWIALLLHDDGISRIVWAVLGALVFWQLLPRPPRVRRRAVAVDEQEAPAVHVLVTAVAGALGCPPPQRVLLDTTYPVMALPVGYGGRSDLVIGLPQWTVLRPQERVAAVAAALAGLDIHRTPAGAVVRIADDLLVAGRELLEPPGTVRGDRVAASYSVSNPIAVDTFEVNREGRSVTKNIGAAGMMALAAPLRWVQRGLLRLWRPRLVTAAHDADARAAAVAGREALVAVLLSTVGTPLGLTAAGSAARYGRDPFDALAHAPRPDRSEYRALLAAESERATGPGPSTAQRVETLERGTPASGTVVDSALAIRADVDVLTLRTDFADQLADELRGVGS